MTAEEPAAQYEENLKCLQILLELTHCSEIHSEQPNAPSPTTGIPEW